MEEELLGNLTGILFVDFIMNSYQTRKKTDKDIQEYNRYYSNQDKIYNSLVRSETTPPACGKIPDLFGFAQEKIGAI